MNNEWFMYIDIENPTRESYVSLSKELDKYGIQGLDVCYYVNGDAEHIFDEAQKMAVEHLNANQVDFEILAEKIDVQTCEDIYHPYGMFDFKDIEDYYTRWNNMLVVTTGCLSRSGGINPTASLLPVIDEFIENQFLSI